MSKRNIIAIGVLFGVLLVAIFVTLYLVSSSQDTRSRADEPEAFPTVPELPVETFDGADADPGEVSNVTVDYPSIEEDVADFTKASCTWDSNPNAATYNLKVTDVNTGTVVKEQQVNSGITKDVFPVTTGNTYRCEVAAVSSSGVAGTAGVDEQICEVEDLADDPTPTPTTPVLTTAPTAPVVTASPTATLVPQNPTATPTLPPTGSVGTIATIGLGGVILMLIGGALLFL